MCLEVAYREYSDVWWCYLLDRKVVLFQENQEVQLKTTHPEAQKFARVKKRHPQMKNRLMWLQAFANHHMHHKEE